MAAEVIRLNNLLKEIVVDELDVKFTATCKLPTRKQIKKMVKEEMRLSAKHKELSKKIEDNGNLDDRLKRFDLTDENYEITKELLKANVVSFDPPLSLEEGVALTDMNVAIDALSNHLPVHFSELSNQLISTAYEQKENASVKKS